MALARYLLDTHILLWAAAGELPAKAESIILDRRNRLFFSSASIWEISIKTRLGRLDFRIDPDVFYRELLKHGYAELSITGAHALMAGSLPSIHKDPFDRMLMAQAIMEGARLLTSDSMLLKYQAPIEFTPKKRVSGD